MSIAHENRRKFRQITTAHEIRFPVTAKRMVNLTPRNDWLDMQRAKARSLPSSTQAARAMGISRRRAAYLRGYVVAQILEAT